MQKNSKIMIIQKSSDYFLLILGIIFMPYCVLILSSNPGILGLSGGIIGIVGAFLFILTSLLKLSKMK